MMEDPKLERASVDIRYRADDGYSSVCGFKSGKGYGDPKPESSLLGALEELARIAALFGHEAEARKAVDDALARVAEWREKRAA